MYSRYNLPPIRPETSGEGVYDLLKEAFFLLRKAVLTNNEGVFGAALYDLLNLVRDMTLQNAKYEKGHVSIYVDRIRRDYAKTDDVASEETQTRRALKQFIKHGGVIPEGAKFLIHTNADASKGIDVFGFYDEEYEIISAFGRVLSSGVGFLKIDDLEGIDADLKNNALTEDIPKDLIKKSDNKQTTKSETGTDEMNNGKATKTPQDLANDRARAKGDVGIVRTGDQIVIPADMSLKEAKVWLERKEADEETEVQVMEMVDAYPFDGALAFSKALVRRYGFTTMVPPRSFFDQPPTFIGVEVSYGVTEQVPWGKMAIPSVSGTLETSITKNSNNQYVFQIGGIVKKKDHYIVKEIAAETRSIVRNESIYRGKAVRMSFNTPERFNPHDVPKFFDLSRAERQAEELTFSKENERVIRTALWTPIEKTAVAIKNHINLKRGILLSGKPGVGKTLTAMVTADKATKNGWTFIYLDTVKNLQQAILFAQQYSPAVIFAEDIDRVTQDRTDAMNEILNVVDGIDTKASNTMIVLTTNNLESIEPVMLRPGRIDTVIDLDPPDASAAERLVRTYARDEKGASLIKAGEDLTLVGKRLAGHIPAVISEVVAKAKLSALNHMELNDEMQLTAEDIETSAIAMVKHIQLLDRPKEVELTDVQVFANVIGGHLKEGLKLAFEELSESSGFTEQKLKELNGKFEVKVDKTPANQEDRA